MIQDMFKFRPLDLLAVLVFFWALITLILNFLVPHDWFFQYYSIEAENPVCQNETQELIGVRWAWLSTPSSGVDQIYPVGINDPADRYPWNDGYYKQGVSTSTWYPTINVKPGEYQWRATTLRLNIAWIFPVYLTEIERPISNTFSVIDC